MATKKTTTGKTTKSAAEPKSTAASGSTKTAKAGTRPESAATAEKKKATKPKKTAAPSAAPAPVQPTSEGILARAEEDVTKLLESLNTQMTAAMHAFEELAAIHRGRTGVVTRTRPIDRATATFQRLVTEVIDERFSEFLPTLVALRVEMEQRAKAAGGDGEQSAEGEFFTRGTEMLDQVLAQAEVQAFEPNVGDAYDPLIHLAVGETSRDDLADDVVSEVFQNGYRTERGKVIQVARVKVNRR